MDEDQILQSIIADPKLTDPSIDVGQLRQTTDTRQELLGNVTDFEGLKFDPTARSYIQDLYSLYGGGAPMLSEPVVDTPVVDTTPIVDTSVMDQPGGDSILDTTPTAITPTVTTPTIIKPVGGGADMATVPTTISSDPFLASGAAGGARLPATQAITTLPSGDVFASDDPMLAEKMDFVTEEDLIDNTNLLQKLGLPENFNLKRAALEAGINLAVGVPVTLIARGLDMMLPDGIQNTTNVARKTGLLTGDSTVTKDKYGINTQSQFGNYDQYNINRVNELEKIVADQKSRDLENTIQMRELIDRKEYLDAKGLTGVGDVDLGRGSGLRPTVDDATGVNPFADIDTGVGEFDTAPVTGVTRPGTVLGKPGIEKFDDAEAALSNLSNTGTSIDALNPNNRQLHFDNTEKLREAARNGVITDAEYKRLSAFDATKTMGLDPVTGTLSAIGYQTVQAAAGDQTVGNAITDIANNIQGVAGNITPEEQVKYQEIITGEKIYRDPILGMVEPPAPMTLADDTINRMTDDVDLDLFDTTPVDTTPMATDRIGTFDADEFSDEAFMVGDTSTAAPTGGDSGADSFFDAVDTAVGGGGGRDRDPDPAPSAPVSTAGQAGPPSQRGGGADIPDRGRGAVSTAGQAGPPSQRGGGDSGGGGGGGGGGGKIVCTMMNESYGFGSFRNKIWLRHSKDLAPEYQKGYHKIFLPLVRLSKKNIVLKKILEHIAVHRTIDIRQESRGKMHLLGRLYRKILEPICYFVGKHG